MLVLSRQQILLLGGDEVRAIDREKWLALAHELVGRIDVNIAQPAGKTRLHISQPALINIHVAGSADFIGHGSHLDGAERHTDALHALGRQLDGRERPLRRLFLGLRSALHRHCRGCHLRLLLGG